MVEDEAYYQRLVDEVLRVIRGECADLVDGGLAAIDLDRGDEEETAKISLKPTDTSAASLTLEIYSEGLLCLQIGAHGASWEDQLDGRDDLLKAARGWVRAVIAGGYREQVRHREGERPPDLIAEVDLPDGTRRYTQGVRALLLGTRGGGWKARTYDPYERP